MHVVKYHRYSFFQMLASFVPTFQSLLLRRTFLLSAFCPLLLWDSFEMQQRVISEMPTSSSPSPNEKSSSFTGTLNIRRAKNKSLLMCV